MAQVTQTSMAVNDLHLFPQAYIPEDGEEGINGREGRGSVNDEERHVVDLEPVGEIPVALAVVVGVGYDDDFVAAVDELGGKLVDMGFHAAGLRKEEVADHCDRVCSTRHVDGGRSWRGFRGIRRWRGIIVVRRMMKLSVSLSSSASRGTNGLVSMDVDLEICPWRGETQSPSSL